MLYDWAHVYNTICNQDQQPARELTEIAPTSTRYWTQLSRIESTKDAAQIRGTFVSIPGENLGMVTQEEKGEEADDAGKQETVKNERERHRVRQVSTAFALLRQHLPLNRMPQRRKDCNSTVDRPRRLSKVKTLRAAIHYIKELTLLLQTSNNA